MSGFNSNVFNVFNSFDKEFKPFDEFFDQQNDFVNRFFSTTPLALESGGEVVRADPFSFSPNRQLVESEKEYNLNIKVPENVSKDNFVLDYDKETHSISVSGEAKKETKNDKGEVIGSSTSSFYQSYLLPSTIREEEIKATFENGDLKLVIPKVAVKKTPIPIEYVDEAKI